MENSALHRHWAQSCSTSSSVIWMKGYRAPSASLLKIWNWDDWMTHLKAVLPFNMTWTDWRVGQKGTWWGLTRASVESSTWGRITTLVSTGEGLTFWKGALQRRIWVSWWTAGWPWASSGSPWCIKNSMANRSRDVILSLYSGPGTLHMESHVQFWGSQFRKGKEFLERVRQRVAKVTSGLEHLPYEERLRELGLFILREEIFSVLINI